MPTIPPLVSKAKLAEVVNAIRQLPTGGSAGQVVRQTDTGPVWGDPPAPTAQQIAAAGAVTSVVKNGVAVAVTAGAVDLGNVGTSNLKVGTTSADAKRGDYSPSRSEVQSAGAVTAVTVNGATYTPSGGTVNLGNITSSSTPTYAVGGGPTL